MRVCMIVNNVNTEQNRYTTTLLAQKMHNRKHDVFYIGVDDLIYHPEGHVGGMAVRANDKTFRTTSSYLENLKSNSENKTKVTSKDIDIILLRNDPAEESKTRPWARVASIAFGQLAIDGGTIVLNDANGLSHALNKIYMQQFPKEIWPETLISRDKKDIQAFFESHKKNIIVKPLFGSGGRSVFQVSDSNAKNLNQMIEAIGQEGYVVAQEFLPESEKGDTRLFLMNGELLKWKGKYAALRRQNALNDIRSNLHAGGEAKPAEVTEEMLKIVELVRPNLIRDGMFFVGLDIIGSKLIEINVFSPGGLFSACSFADRDFTEPYIQALEHKLYLKSIYKEKISNCRLATL